MLVTLWANLNSITFLEKLLWLLFGQCVVKLGYFLVYRLVALPVPMNALCKWQHWHIFLLFFTRRKFRSNLQQKWSTKKFKYKVFKCTTSTTTCTPTYLRQVWMVSCNMRRSRSLFASISQKHFLVQVIFTFSSFRASLGRFVESVTVHFFFRNDDWLWWSIQRENFFFVFEVKFCTSSVPTLSLGTVVSEIFAPTISI